MDGILNINKPKGITSHDVVSAIRGIIGERRVGHTGTLDPIATGVLLLCVGRATKLSRFLTNCKKTYVADMKLGAKTDTQDSTGAVTVYCSDYSIDEKRVADAFLKFTGDIRQTPPMYSAAKHKGVRLYTLARKGITVERKTKDVHIYKIKLLGASHEFIRFEAEVSPGTYIRTLCEQIGDELGCYGHLYELQRTVIGDFKIRDAVSIEDVDMMCKSGRLSSILTPAHSIN